MKPVYIDQKRCADLMYSELYFCTSAVLVGVTSRWTFCTFAVLFWGYIQMNVLYICNAGLGLHPDERFVHLLCWFVVTSRWTFCTFAVWVWGYTWMTVLYICCAGLGLLLHAGECFVHVGFGVTSRWLFCTFAVQVWGLTSRWLFHTFAVQVWGTHMRRTTPRT